MLLEQAFIFKLNNQNKDADLCATICKTMIAEDDRFLKDILRRSIIQYVSNLTFDEEEKTVDIQFKHQKNKPLLSQKEAKKFLNLMLQILIH